MDWPFHRLEELTEPDRPITYGVVKPGPEDPDNGVKFIRGGDIFEGKLAVENLRTITPDVSKSYSRTLLSGGELVVSLVGNPGHVAVVPKSLAGANLARQAGLVALRKEIDADFVKFFLMSPQGRAELFAQMTGSVQVVINLHNLRTVRVPLPLLPVQRRIAGILSAYDDLIENNRRRIQILERMAQALYREWFVNFRFPGHAKVKFVASPLGKIPEGWFCGTVNDVLSLKSGFAFRSGTFTDDGIYGLVTIRNVHDGLFIPDCTSRIAELPSNMPSYCQLSAGDVLLSLTGNIGRACLVYGQNYLLNQRVAKLVPHAASNRAYAYFTFRQDEIQNKLMQIANGVAQQNLSPVETGKMPVVLPPQKVLADFAETSEPIVEQILVLFRKNANLRRTRDLLLPKLISGAVDVSKLDIETA